MTSPFAFLQESKLISYLINLFLFQVRFDKFKNTPSCFFIVGKYYEYFAWFCRESLNFNEK